jgi:hypothetical protein
MGGCRVCQMLAKLFLQNGTWTRFSKYAVTVLDGQKKDNSAMLKMKTSSHMSAPSGELSLGLGLAQLLV